MNQKRVDGILVTCPTREDVQNLRVQAYKDNHNPTVATEKYKARNLVCRDCGQRGHQACATAPWYGAGGKDERDQAEKRQ